MSRALWALVGVAVSALALTFAFYRLRTDGGWHLVARIDGRELAAALRAARPGWLAGYVLLSVGSLLPRALELRALTRRRDGGPPRLWAAWHAQAVSLLGHNVLPARLGEAARIVALARSDDVAPAAATGAVVLSRLFDLPALVLATGLPLWALPVGSTGVGRKLRLPAALGLGLAVVLVAALRALAGRREQVTRWAHTRGGPRLSRLADELTLGLAALSSPGRLRTAALASLAAPLVIAGSFACALAAFALDLPAGSALALTGVTLAAIAVPSAPSALGVYEAAVLWLLPALGAPPARAAAFALATHALGLVAFVLVGLPSVFRVLSGRPPPPSPAPAPPPPSPSSPT